MPISENDVDKIAELAKLKLNTNEKDRLLVDLNRILEYMEIISEVDTYRAGMSADSAVEETALRDDKLTQGNTSKEALKNAPASKDNLIKVPRVINPQK